MSSTDEVVQEARLVGQVKWFNNKAGYGFITVSDGDHSGKDIFVHFTTVRVANSQYKYLIQGEYVEFSLTKSTSGTHEYQATDVSGIKSGALMCETRRNNRVSEGDEPAKPQRRYRVPNDDSRPPRSLFGWSSCCGSGALGWFARANQKRGHTTNSIADQAAKVR
jgi:CspA family cold shock protein